MSQTKMPATLLKRDSKYCQNFNTSGGCFYNCGYGYLKRTSRDLT